MKAKIMTMKDIRLACAGTDIQSINLHANGCAWEVAVRVRGVAYAATYIGARLNIRLAPAERPSRRRAWHVDAIKAWSIAKVLELPQDWHARHEAMHGVREQREAVRRAAFDRLLALEAGAA